MAQLYKFLQTWFQYRDSTRSSIPRTNSFCELLKSYPPNQAFLLGHILGENGEISPTWICFPFSCDHNIVVVSDKLLGEGDIILVVDQDEI